MTFEDISYVAAALAIIGGAVAVTALILRQLGVRHKIALAIIIVGCLILVLFAIIYFKMLGS